MKWSRTRLPPATKTLKRNSDAMPGWLPAGYRLIETAPLTGAPGTYTYAVPPQFAHAVAGRRVLVRLGQKLQAAVVLGDAADETPRESVKEIEDVLDDGPLLTKETLELAKWAAEYYLAPLSLAVRAALPPSSEAVENRTPKLNDKGREVLRSGGISPANRQALRAIDLGETQVLKEATILRLAREGFVTFESTVDAGAYIPIIEFISITPGAEATFTGRQARQAEVYERLKTQGIVKRAEAAEVIGAAPEVLRRLVERGLVSVEQRPYVSEIEVPPDVPPPLTGEQAAALEALLTEMKAAAPRPVLLEGVTGSGKTEVYLRLIAQAHAEGHPALVLVPEISLTPQLSRRFRARFGKAVAVLHSGLGDRERASEWHRVRRGEASIVVGARSAVWAPVARPRVIIVDEEHDGSFKQDGGLRYHGRDLALVRAKAAGALVVLGSATPSLESVFNAKSGRFLQLRMTERVDVRPMPTVELIDLRGRMKPVAQGSHVPSGLVSPRLADALRQTIIRGEQAIVFLNRRGHSTAVICQDCGVVHLCGSCAVAMTWHDRRKSLVCHYCGARQAAPAKCGACKSTRLLFSGAGTEKLETELADLLPGARIARLDRDTASTTKRLEEILGRFARLELDVILGTQMIAKGHDFPGVTLVGVLLADAGLHQPDFRAAERTAQLLTQVAGRAGRGEKPGAVLVQTFDTAAPAVRAVLGHSYAAFAEAELLERENAGYPPFRRLAMLRIEGESEPAAAGIAQALAQKLSNAAGTEVLGPAPAPIPMLRGKHRFQVLLKALKPSALRAAIYGVAGIIRQPGKGVRISVDVDPGDLL